MNKNALLISLIALAFPLIAGAEFTCRQEVLYKWKKPKEDTEIQTSWTTVEVKAADEALAKHGLDEPLQREIKRAREECEREHENLAGCVASKFTSLAPTMERLSFSQRKSLEEAVQADCSGKQGTCTSIVVAEAKCAEAGPKKEEGAEAEGKGAEKKDAKGKKK